ncbi:MAG: hypothetical protein ABI779_22845 [Acidobacteriota bacterium]
MRTDVVLLPGMHGSTALFEGLIASAPRWARCRAIPLPLIADQSFEALAMAIEPQVRELESFVLFAESFSAPIGARLARRLGSKVSLLVLCSPLIELPWAFAPSLASWLIRRRWTPRWSVALALTGGDGDLASAVLREVWALPEPVLSGRLAAAFAARRDDGFRDLQAPFLGIAGSKDRLTSPSRTEELVGRVPLAAYAEIEAPHLAAQVAPHLVWAAFESAA